MIPDLTLIYEKEMPNLNQLANKRLTFAYYNHSFSFQTKPDYFRFLKNIQELSIFACDILIQRINEGDVEYFQHLQSLTICNSHILKSVKGLGSIPTLRILDCENLWDISGLGRNRFVELKACSKIQDINALATVPIVEIRHCPRVMDYTCLSNIQRLTVCK